MHTSVIFGCVELGLLEYIPDSLKLLFPPSTVACVVWYFRTFNNGLCEGTAKDDVGDRGGDGNTLYLILCQFMAIQRVNTAAVLGSYVEP